MTFSAKYLVIMAIFPLTLLINLILPDAANRPDQPKEVFNLFLILFFLLLLFFVVHGHIMKRQPMTRIRTVMDVGLIFGVFFFLWAVLVGKIGLLDHLRFPSPNTVFDVYRIDFDLLVVRSTMETMIRLMEGYFVAIILAIPLGLIVGRRRVLHDSVYYPIAKTIAPIPPIIFVPYAIELLPSINTAVIFVIFIGAFWPVAVNTIYGVRNLDPTYIEAAKTLGVSERRLYTKILFPAALPSIYAGLFIGLYVPYFKPR